MTENEINKVITASIRSITKMLPEDYRVTLIINKVNEDDSGFYSNIGSTVHQDILPFILNQTSKEIQGKQPNEYPIKGNEA